jgi:hypothetical protein
MEEAMPEEMLQELDEDSAAIDENSLAGLSEYSATGGGGQPLHVPRMVAEHEVLDEPEVPDPTSFRELYRYSLGRATQDAHAEYEDDLNDDGLHVERSSGIRRKKR